MAEDFKKGDLVMIKSLKTEGTIIEKIKSGDYRVAKGAFVKTCKASDLKALPREKWNQFSGLKKPKYSAPEVKKPVGRDYASVDLHGLRLLEAIRLLDQQLNAALLADVDRFQVTHGLGTGTLLKGVHDHLSKLSVVKRFHLDERNPGVTWVYF